ncbi:MAG: FHA domain-containing protein [Hyphomicrobiaceae bacterium]
MANDNRGETGNDRRMMGSLRDALAAAGQPSKPPAVTPPLPAATPVAPNTTVTELPMTSAAAAVREARGGERGDAGHVELEVPQSKLVRSLAAKPAVSDGTAARTQLLRGRQNIKKADFFQDPVVGWLVVVGGTGLGAFRPIYEGNNTVGRAKSQRIAIDFGDETISNEEQAYIRYDSVDRKFLLVPNLAKTNIVAVNDRKPTGAVELAAMDLITMGRTQLVFVPFCGGEFDWAELSEAKG